MRKFWTGVLIVALLCGCTQGSLAQSVSEQDNTILARGPVVQKVSTTSAVIMGRPVDALLAAEVTVEVNTMGYRKIQSSGKYDENKDTFEIEVAGLPANAPCTYSVMIDSQRVGPFDFRTAPSGPETPVRFAAYGDTRTRTEMHALVANAILRERPRFVLCSGDLVTDGRNDAEWDAEYFGPARNLLANVPVFPCLGNHEHRGRRYFDLHALPGNESYYDFTYGPVRVVTLDQYQAIEEGSEQYAWADKTLAQEFSGWTLVQFHEPPFGANPERGFSARWIDLLVPLMEKHKVDLVVNGHDHYYLRNVPLSADGTGHPVQYIISGGGGAPTYDVSANAPGAAKTYSGLHFLVCDATHNTLACRVLTEEGEVVDTFKLSRSSPATPNNRADLIPIDLLHKAAYAMFQQEPIRSHASEIVLPFTNPLDSPVTVGVKWQIDGTHWQVAPIDPPVTVPGKEQVTLRTSVTPPDQAHYYPAPTATAILTYTPSSGTETQIKVAGALAAINSPSAVAKRVAKEPKIDGLLDDGCWKQAVPAPLIWRSDANGKTQNATTAFIVATPDALCVAVDCKDDDMENVQALQEVTAWKDDCIEVFVDCNIDRTSAWQFITSVAGVAMDLPVGKADPDAFSGKWTQAVTRADDGWTLEIRLPWSAVGLKEPPKAGTEMGFNIARLERNLVPGTDGMTLDTTQWAVTRASNRAVARFGTLTIEP